MSKKSKDTQSFEEYVQAIKLEMEVEKFFNSSKSRSKTSDSEKDGNIFERKPPGPRSAFEDYRP